MNLVYHLISFVNQKIDYFFHFLLYLILLHVPEYPKFKTMFVFNVQIFVLC